MTRSRDSILGTRWAAHQRLLCRHLNSLYRRTMPKRMVCGSSGSSLSLRWIAITLKLIRPERLLRLHTRHSGQLRRPVENSRRV